MEVIKVDRNKGFSLVEMMVVVAIIGILASIAIPNYMDMIGRARQAEGKSYLSAMYATEQSWYAERGFYTCCLYQAGFIPTINTRYYFSGFWNAPCDIVYDKLNGTACTNAPIPWVGGLRGDCTFYMNAWANPALSVMVPAAVPGAYGVSNGTFTAVVWGSVSTVSNLYDMWTINNLNSVVNVQTGI